MSNRYKLPEPVIDIYYEGNHTLAELEKEIIIRVLKKNNYNRTETAKELDIGERTLYSKLQEYKINDNI